MIHNSGDPFTKGWHNPPYHTDESLTGRGWIINFFEMLRDAGLMPAPVTIGFDAGIVSGYGTFGVFDGGWLGFEMGGGIDTPIGGASIDYYIKIRIRMLREGGSELRAVIPVVGNQNINGESFSWSSADATNFDLGFTGGGGFEAWITIPIIDQDITIIDIDFDITVADEHMTIGFNFGGSESGCFEDEDGNETCETVEGDADIVIYDGSFPTSAPLGASFVHSGKTNKNELTLHPDHMGTDVDLGLPFPTPSGSIPGDAYGKAASRLLGWYYPPGGFASGVYFQPPMPGRNLTNKYKGLPRYIDTTGAEPLYKSGGPFLLVGLKLGQDEFKTEHYDDAGAKEPDADGMYGLKEAFGWDDMTAIAKSEVYFKRPLDLDYFARGDGYVEHGSAFNPYWQARLIETSHADRVIALLLQHGELAQGISFGSDIESLAEWMESALGGL